MDADELKRDLVECLDLYQRLTVGGRCIKCAIAEVDRGDQAVMDGFAPEMSVQVVSLLDDWRPRMGERVSFEGRVLRVVAISHTPGDVATVTTLEPVQARG